MSGAYSMGGEVRNTYKVSFGKPEGKKQLGRHVVDGRIILR